MLRKQFLKVGEEIKRGNAMEDYVVILQSLQLRTGKGVMHFRQRNIT